MEKKGRQIDGISFHPNTPTQMTFADLYAWVIWQFPLPASHGHCGAVRSSEPEVGWIPALVFYEQSSILVYAHLEEQFSGPEEAARWLLDHMAE